ncbi:hypothetical protein ACFQI3_00240 [Hansschlegelia quercus]|uniref:hypothetical protein n=1 Tax=Hansschlegelia quercus TaxID=2528245 RepID=UPI001FDF9A50|nr:hypothetical protein [Hansschlegelia quercus]
MKEIFDERGIEMPYPHLTLYMGEDRQGKAPPLRVEGRIAAETGDRRPAPPPPRQQAAANIVTGHDGPADEGGFAPNG